MLATFSIKRFAINIPSLPSTQTAVNICHKHRCSRWNTYQNSLNLKIDLIWSLLPHFLKIAHLKYIHFQPLCHFGHWSSVILAHYKIILSAKFRSNSIIPFCLLNKFYFSNWCRLDSLLNKSDPSLRANESTGLSQCKRLRDFLTYDLCHFWYVILGMSFYKILKKVFLRVLASIRWTTICLVIFLVGRLRRAKVF